MIIEVKNLDQPWVCCAVTSVWPSEGSPMPDHLNWTWMTYQKSQKLRVAHKTPTYWFELLIRKVKNSDHKTSTYYLLIGNVKNSDQPIRLQTYSLELLNRNVKNSDQPIRLQPIDLNCWSEMSKSSALRCWSNILDIWSSLYVDNCNS